MNIEKYYLNRRFKGYLHNIKYILKYIFYLFSPELPLFDTNFGFSTFYFVNICNNNNLIIHNSHSLDSMDRFWAALCMFCWVLARIIR